MAVVFYDGFEGGTFSLSGWIRGGSGTVPSIVAVARPRPTGAAGAYSLSLGVANDVSAMPYRNFPWNPDQGRRIRLREAYLGCAYVPETNSIGGTAAQLGRTQIGFTTGNNQRVGFTSVGAQTRLLTAATAVLTTTNGSGVTGDFQTYWFSAFIDNVNGTLRVQNGNLTATYATFTGDTQITDAYVSAVKAGRYLGGTYNNLDDVLVIAPSLAVNITNPAALVQDDVLTGAGGGSVLVSDYEPSKGRIWVHSWNGTPFANGEVITGPGGFGATIHAPLLGGGMPEFVNGFEPLSFPTDLSSLPYIIELAPTANVVVALTPVGDPSNVLNVNATPEVAASYNEATSGATLADSYGTFGALPAWVTRVLAVEQDGAVNSTGTYVTGTLTLTDGTGAQTTSSALSAVIERLSAPWQFRADGSVWTPANATNLVVAYEFS
jgi:hypothetical protein